MDDRDDAKLDRSVSEQTDSTMPSFNQGRRPTQMHIDRPVMYETNLEEIVKRTTEEKKEQTTKRRQRLRNKLMDKEKIKKNVCSALYGFFPVISLFRNYPLRDYFIKDLMSGISVGLIVIPQAIAYAVLANLKPQNGFYSAFYGMLIYFIFGTSHHLNMSSQGVVSLLVGTMVQEVAQCAPGGNLNTTVTAAFDSVYDGFNTTLGPNAGEDCATKIQYYTLALTFMCGLFQLLFGICRFGIISIFLSDALVNAFTCGAALHIVESQAGDLLGLKDYHPYKGFGQFYFIIGDIINAFPSLNPYAVIISIICCAILIGGRFANDYIMKKISIPVPFDIIVLFLSLLASYYGEFQKSLGIDVVGPIEKGFQAPRLPEVSHIGEVWVRSIILAAVGYAMCISTAKMYAVKHDYEVNANQELMSYGLCNLAIGMGNGFVSASSLACTSLHESLGGKTQIYSLVATIITLVGIVGFGPVFKDVPKAALSAVIMVNLYKMIFQVTNVVTLWKVNKFDWLIWVVTFLSVVSVKVEYGLGIGMMFSLVTVIYRTHSAAAYCLGRVPGTDVYRNIKRNKSAQVVPGIKIFKFEGNIYFGSAENFRSQLYSKTKLNPKKLAARLRQQEQAAAAEELEHSLDGESFEMHSSTSKRPSVNDGREQRIVEMSLIGQAMRNIREDDNAIEEENQGQVYTLEARDRHKGNSEVETTISGNQDDDDATASRSEDLDTTSKSVPVKYIIIDMSACAFIDSVGVRVLQQIIKDYEEVGIQLLMSNVAIYVRKQLLSAGFKQDTERNHAYVTVHDAVLAALETLMNQYMETEFLHLRGSIISAVRPERADTQPESSNTEKQEIQKITEDPHSSEPLLSTERAMMQETIQQLMHHNKMLRKMLDKKENADPADLESMDDEEKEDTRSKVHRVTSKPSILFRKAWRERFSSPSMRHGAEGQDDSNGVKRRSTVKDKENKPDKTSFVNEAYDGHE